MHGVVLRGRGDLGEWRDAARGLLAAGVRPADVDWRIGSDGGALFAAPPPPATGPAAISVPRAFLDLAEAVVCHRDPGRFALLYRLLVRLQDDRGLLADIADADVTAARRLEKSVRRDCHKMTAFVRFNELPGAGAGRRRFCAWFEPDHHIVARTAPFFARRFADMDWMILTPAGTAAFADGALTLSDEPAEKPDLADPTDDLWRTYYASIFNPARVKVKAMQAEMPKKYWKNLPEAALIADLIATAPARVAAMADQAAQPPPAFHTRLQARRALVDDTPQADTLDGLRAAARNCTRCPLHRCATQTVFGEGPDRAALMIVGEQPGDREDLAGRPFVGPAGQVFDQVAAEVGLDRAAAYVTNAVKHFKHEPRGKRRLHRTPDAPEVEQCRWWLDREIDLVRPRLILGLGATALHALTGARGRLGDRRGRVMDLGGGRAVLATVHPSYLLRLPDPGVRAAETGRFRDDLATAVRLVAAPR